MATGTHHRHPAGTHHDGTHHVGIHQAGNNHHHQTGTLGLLGRGTLQPMHCPWQPGQLIIIRLGLIMMGLIMLGVIRLGLIIMGLINLCTALGNQGW
jgi:hypothetical protein